MIRHGSYLHQGIPGPRCGSSHRECVLLVHTMTASSPQINSPREAPRVSQTDADDRTRVLVEVALDRHPFCRACGQPTTVIQEDGALWLECVSYERPRHPLLRLVTADFTFGHDRELLLESLAA